MKNALKLYGSFGRFRMLIAVPDGQRKPTKKKKARKRSIFPQPLYETRVLTLKSSSFWAFARVFWNSCPGLSRAGGGGLTPSSNLQKFCFFAQWFLKILEELSKNLQKFLENF
jgi:hypothetical protein